MGAEKEEEAADVATPVSGGGGGKNTLMAIEMTMLPQEGERRGEGRRVDDDVIEEFATTRIDIQEEAVSPAGRSETERSSPARPRRLVALGEGQTSNGLSSGGHSQTPGGGSTRTHHC
eukprot:GHVU01117967.1.p2 GENE.GHVU01117967.1~~GHVU01117967.1.p2  ORF type:complete len:136 (-),score=32.31 GHVU01117967.1:181-534(-)